MDLVKPASAQTLPDPPGTSRLVVVAVAVAVTNVGFVQLMLLPVLADLPDLLHADADDTAWVLTAALLASAICTPIAGRLGDMYGKRRVLLILLAFLILGSVLCAISARAPLMIAGRALQGCGIGVFPLGVSILRDVLPVRQLSSAVATVSSALSLGGVLALPIGAICAAFADWRLLFWVVAGLGLIAFAMLAALVPESAVRAPGRLDFLGIAGLAIGLLTLLVAVSRGNSWGWSSPLTIGLLFAATIVLLAWVWHELRIAGPMIDLRIALTAPVLLTNIAAAAIGFALFAPNVLLPQVLKQPIESGGLGLSVFVTGFALVPGAVATAAGSLLARSFERLIGPIKVLLSGSTVLATSYVLLIARDLDVWNVMALSTVNGVGIGLAFAALPILVMRYVPEEQTGAANGLNTLIRSIGSTLASAVGGTILATGVSGAGNESDSGTAAFHLVLALALAASVLSILATAVLLRISRETRRSG